jgi:probable selenium-dependent hydroxylase accessory protein YqeC
MSDRLRDALLLKDGGVVSLVGAGGKTSLMFRLARELSRKGERVLTTTTTRIHAPTAEQSPACILAVTAEEILERAAPVLSLHRHITAAAGLSADPGKLVGLTPEMVDRLRASQLFDWIIVEADGAAGRPLKAPAEHEPVIPSSSGWLVGMVGLRALGTPLTDQWVFRAEMFSRITGLPLGMAVTEEAITTALAHERGVLKDAPGECRCLAFLNQADAPGANVAGLRIAGLLKRLGSSRIQRTIVGHVLGETPIAAVFDLSG